MQEYVCYGDRWYVVVRTSKFEVIFFSMLQTQKSSLFKHNISNFSWHIIKKKFRLLSEICQLHKTNLVRK